MLYERIIVNLNSEIVFLREQMKSRDIQLKEEILYLRNQLDIYVHKSLLKSDGVDILSDGEIPNLMPKRSNDCANEVTKNRSSQNNGNKTSSDIKKIRENDISEKRTIYRAINY